MESVLLTPTPTLLNEDITDKIIFKSSVYGIIFFVRSIINYFLLY